MPKKTNSTIKSTTFVSMADKVSAEDFVGKKLPLSTVAQLVVDLQHNKRRPTAHTKTRGEVAGSTKKPWRQKGTGRARVGTKRTPVWRGGGRVFGPGAGAGRQFNHKINQALIAPAINALLAEKATAGEIFNLSGAYVSDGKTKNALKFFQTTLDPKSNLIIIAQTELKLAQAVRNLPYIIVRRADQVNLLDIAIARHIIFLPEALPALIARLK
ncbi:MAG: 50S ribosomal protein L4 [Patescibacteria group bacterium]